MAKRDPGIEAGRREARLLSEKEAKAIRRRAELEALLEWTAEHPEMAQYIDSGKVQLALIRYLQALVSDDVAAFVNQCLGTE